MANCSSGLTDRERQILRFWAGGMTDYKIAAKLRIEAPSVTRSRLTALRKVEKAKSDVAFFDSLVVRV